MRKFNVFASFILFTLLISSCQNPDKVVEQNHTATPILIDTSIAKPNLLDTIASVEKSAIDLTKDYVSNQVKADKDYMGKIIIVNGIVEDIRKGYASDKPFVSLKGCERFTSVQCYLDDQTALELKKGMKIRLKGKCEGLNVNVIMNNCERLLGESK